MEHMDDTAVHRNPKVDPSSAWEKTIENMFRRRSFDCKKGSSELIVRMKFYADTLNNGSGILDENGGIRSNHAQAGGNKIGIVSDAKVGWVRSNKCYEFVSSRLNRIAVSDMIVGRGELSELNSKGDDKKLTYMSM
eukprot:scaffold3402_cov62-Cylindrotheca_fusiformis.AAC.1